MEDITHFSTRSDELNHTRKPTRRILPSSPKPNMGTRPQLNVQLQVQDFVYNDDGNEGGVVRKETGRERLKRHREEVAAGRVMVPDTWGQENLLKDWIDYTSFDKLIAPAGLASAREALVAEGRRGSCQRMRVENRC